MLRILHSLPRTHKLLLLPVATLVTVLGTQKLISSYPPQASSTSVVTSFPISSETPPLNTTPWKASPTEGGPERASSASLDQGALHIATVVGTLGLGMLDDIGVTSDVASQAASSIDAASSIGKGATSYSDYDIDFLDDPSLTAPEPVFVPTWQTHIVDSGETFAVVASQALGLGYRQALQLLDELPDPQIFTRWRAGASFDYQLDRNGRLLALRMMEDSRRGVRIEREADTFRVTSIERQGEAVQRLYAGSLNGSFARSAQSTGLSNKAINDITKLLQKRLDFRRDSRRGDAFKVLVEYDMIDGELFDSRVLAVTYEGQRMTLTLARNPKDNRFYTPDGQSLDPAFARRPFEGNFRISSSYNPRRKHPVTGRISPHNGTDFAMPTGTPITAPANGRVERTAYHHAAGNYVDIRHDNGYRTRYLHLSRSLVQRGDRVKMGQRIALSGNTGRSTGPHLHYEVLVNNTPVNAMRVDLPENASLTGNTLIAFQKQADPLLSALQSGSTGTIEIAAYAAD